MRVVQQKYIVWPLFPCAIISKRIQQRCNSVMSGACKHSRPVPERQRRRHRQYAAARPPPEPDLRPHPPRRFRGEAHEAPQEQLVRQQDRLHQVPQPHDQAQVPQRPRQRPGGTASRRRALPKRAVLDRAAGQQRERQDEELGQEGLPEQVPEEHVDERGERERADAESGE